VEEELHRSRGTTLTAFPLELTVLHADTVECPARLTW
jgi:hypothetical protein